jgi:S-adenosylmethionine/arginine decarboxylase-like enzyme
METNEHLNDHHLFEVKLLVAIPNYYCGEHQPEASAIDEIMSALAPSDATVIGIAERRMIVTAKEESK